MSSKNLGIAIIIIAILIIAGAFIFINPFLLSPNSSSSNLLSPNPPPIQSSDLPEPKIVSLPSPNIFSDLQSVSKPVTVTGNIQDLETGFASGVTVTLNTSEETVSNSKGNYSIQTSYAGETIISFEKLGYVPVHKTVFLGRDEHVNVLMQKSAEKQTVNLNQAIDVQQNGAGLKASANSFVVKATGERAESANVSLTVFDPTIEEQRSVFPGEFEGMAVNGENVGLESFGFAKISVENEAGETLDLADGETATLRIPIPESQTNAPETIPLWYFDPKRETWIEAGTAVKKCENQTCAYEGKINTIASWWNADKISITSGLSGTVDFAEDAWDKLRDLLGLRILEWLGRFQAEKEAANGDYVIEDEKAKAFIEAIRKLEERYPNLSPTEIANAVNFVIQSPWDYETGFLSEVKIPEDELLAVAREVGLFLQFEVREGGIAHSNKEEYVSRELDVDFTHVNGVVAAMQDWENSGIINRGLSAARGFAYSHGGDAAQMVGGYASAVYEGIKTMSWPSSDFERARASYPSDQYNGDSLGLMLREVVISKDNSVKLSNLVEFAVWQREHELKGDLSKQSVFVSPADSGTIYFQSVSNSVVCSQSKICLDGNFLELENQDNSFMFLKKANSNPYLVLFLVGSPAETSVDFEETAGSLDATFFGESISGRLLEDNDKYLFTAKQAVQGISVRVMIYSEHSLNSEIVNALLSGIYYSPESLPSQTRGELLNQRLSEFEDEIIVKLKSKGLNYSGTSSVNLNLTSPRTPFQISVRENSEVELILQIKNYVSFPVHVQSGAQSEVKDLGNVVFEFGINSCIQTESPGPCIVDYVKIFERKDKIENAVLDQVLNQISDVSKRARAYLYFAVLYTDVSYCEKMKDSYYYTRCVDELSAKTGSLDTCLKHLDGTDIIKEFNAFACIKEIDPNKEFAYADLVNAIKNKAGINSGLYEDLGIYYGNDQFCENIPLNDGGAPTCYKEVGIALKNADTCLKSLDTAFESFRQWYAGWCIEFADKSKEFQASELIEKIKKKPQPFFQVLSRLGGYYGNTLFCEQIDIDNGSAPECYRDAGITAKDVDICMRSLDTTHFDNVWYASWCIRDVDKAKQLGYDTLIEKLNAKPVNKDSLLNDLAGHYSDKRFCSHIERDTGLYFDCK